MSGHQWRHDVSSDGCDVEVLCEWCGQYSAGASVDCPRAPYQTPRPVWHLVQVRLDGVWDIWSSDPEMTDSEWEMSVDATDLADALETLGWDPDWVTEAGHRTWLVQAGTLVDYATGYDIGPASPFDRMRSDQAAARHGEGVFGDRNGRSVWVRP